MLITFSCEAYENITLFGDVAKQLLQMMGHSGTIPGAMKADEIPAAIEKLRNALALQDDDEEDEDNVSLAKRAYPLIQMLLRAEKLQCNVMWSET